MSDQKNYTTINNHDIAEFGLDADMLGKTVTAAEYKKLTGLNKVTLNTKSVTEGNKGVAESTADEADEPDAEGDEYDAMKGEDLKAELEKRELPTSGKVDELRARLREDDAAKA